ncbi:cysteine-rich KTR domain-containing protein [Peptoniphilus mikwangii]
MRERQWLLCPVCKNKTRLQIREDTELKNFSLLCPKCKHETLINVKQFNVSLIKEPDATTSYGIRQHHHDPELLRTRHF